MNATPYTIVAILIAVPIGLFIGYLRFYKDRKAYLERVQAEQKAKVDYRALECRTEVERFKQTYAYLGQLPIPEARIHDMIMNGAGPSDINQLLRECLHVPGFINLGTTSDKPWGVLLPPDLRDTHVYIVGKSGSGKTNFMRHMIRQDLEAGNGIGVLAPEYEMLNEEILPFIPENRIRDVIYFNPEDLECPVVFNPLHREQDEDVDLLVDETFTILQRVIGDGGPRMDEILRNALYALIERPGSTLLDIEPLLDRNNASFRNEVLRAIDNDITIRFFTETYPLMQKDAHLPVINRIGKVLRSQFVRNCLCPPSDAAIDRAAVSKRLLDIRKAMDTGKILLFNLSDGRLGTGASQLIGQLIVSKFQTATMSRADVTQEERRPFYLYLDEFQNFCGTAAESYAKIFSRARKYHLGLILAHQQTHQIPPSLLKEILGSVSTIMSFRVSHSDAVRLVKELGVGYLNPDQTADDAAHLLTNLERGTCIGRIENYTSHIRVPLVDKASGDGSRTHVVTLSRETYGIPRRGQTPESLQGPPNERPPDPLSDLDAGKIWE